MLLAVDVGNTNTVLGVFRDAKLIADTFRSLGFATVTLAPDLTRDKFFAALRDFGAEAELNAHALHDLVALRYDLFLKLEGRNAERQQATDALVPVKYDRLDAVPDENIRTP